MRKVLPAVFILLLAHAGLFSVRQWQAESSYPVQRSFIRGGYNVEIPDENQAERIKRSIYFSPGIQKYHVLLGKHHAYGARPGTDRLRGAEEEYLEAIYLNPSYTEVLAYLAWVKFSMGKSASALKLLEDALRLEPDNYFNHIFFGICISEFLDTLPGGLRTAYIYRAEEEFQEGLSLNPSMGGHPSVLMGRAKLYLRRGDTEAAVRELNRASVLKKTTLPHHLMLAGLFLKSGKVRQGVNKYRRLLAHPKNDDHDQETIIASLREDAGMYADAPGLKLLLGEAYIRQKAWNQALQTLKGAVGLGAPASADAHYMMGRAHEALGNESSAYDEYVKALEHSGDHPGASGKILDFQRKKLRGSAEKG
jgi:tetratricopeptide (TPR) repeat protein